MRTKRRIWKSITACVIGAAALSSCVEDPEPVILDALPDVFIQKVAHDSVPEYGIAFWLLANKNLASVTVESPDSETHTLESVNSNLRVFSLLPGPDEYTDSIPEQGNYVFTVTSTQVDEAPKTFTDVLEQDELGIVTTDTIYFDDGKLNTSWQAVESADAYYVRMYDESDKQVFLSPQIENDETEYAFGVYDTGWIDPQNKAADGETFRLEVIAILYESDATSANKDYNVQFMSIAPLDIEWGE